MITSVTIIRLIKKQGICVLVLLLGFLILVAGCLGDMEPFPGSSADIFSALLVPDTNLELYVYAGQDRPTIVPAKFLNMPYDVKVESLAMWGLPSEKTLILGAGLTFSNTVDLSGIYSGIKSEQNVWKILRDNKIYIVQGVGAAAESLKAAISNNSFKYYTNGSVLETVTVLPRGGSTRMMAIVVAKPSNQVLSFTAEYIGKNNIEQVSRILKLINPEVVIGGLYSPHQINVARAIEVFEKGSGTGTLDAGMLVLVKSGLPGFVVGPAVRSLLNDYGFTETRVGEVAVYKGFWSTPGSGNIPILVRIEDNQIFVAISGQEAYAQTLITTIYR